MKKIAIMITLLALFAGCASQNTTELVPINKTTSCSKPYISYEGSCCLDMDENQVCDYLEKATTTSSSSTSSTTKGNATNSTTTTTQEDPCSNRRMDPGESGVDCGGSCEPCRDMCEQLIRDKIMKPAARTTTLCLSNAQDVSYEGLNLSFDRGATDMKIKAVKVDGSTEQAEISRYKDAVIGNTVLRLIGTARANGVNYLQAYAWTIEGGIRCSMHNDCGPEQVVKESLCINGRQIIRQYVTYRCAYPGTIMSECQATQKQETLVECGADEMCVPGEDECFRKECYNDLEDGDETDVDCGGSCRPCHCFNNRTDEDEEDTDCGGSCISCIKTEVVDKTPPSVRILSPTNKTYNEERINLTVRLNESGNCSYQLNDKPLAHMQRLDISIFPQRGQNKVIVTCQDEYNNTQKAMQTFNLELMQGQACKNDEVSHQYLDRFDSAVFHRDDENELGVADFCTQKIYDYALTYVNDSGRHQHTEDLTSKMNDSSFEPDTYSTVGYECTTSGRLRTAYIRLREPEEPSRLGKAVALLYFKEKTSPGTSGFWRVYAYNTDKESVRLGAYIDIPYSPRNSSCAGRYQELDFSGLLGQMSGSLDLRIGLYTNAIYAEVSLTEAELYKETKKK